LTTPRSAQVVDATDVLAVAKRLQLIAERAACAAGAARTACRAFRTGLDELAELPKNPKLDVNEVVALEVLGGAIRACLALRLA
jgi:hypothetical protein